MGAVAAFRFGPSKADWKATATSEQNAKFPAAKASHIRLISLKGSQNKPYAGAAEFGVLTGE